MAVATIVANIWDLRYCVAVATIIACRKMRFQKCAVTTAHLHVCAHAMRVIQPCAFGTVYRRGYKVDGLMHEHIFYARLQPRPSVDGHL